MSTPDSQGRDLPPQPTNAEKPPDPADALPPDTSAIPPHLRQITQQAAPTTPIPNQSVLPPHLAAAQSAQPTPIPAATPVAPALPQAPQIPQAPTVPVAPTAPAIPAAPVVPQSPPSQSTVQPAHLREPSQPTAPATPARQQPVAAPSPKPTAARQTTAAPKPAAAQQPVALPTHLPSSSQPAPRAITNRQQPVSPPSREPTPSPQTTAPPQPAASPVPKQRQEPTPDNKINETDESDSDLREKISSFRNTAIEFVKRVAVPSAPPWMVSMLVHLVILIILALIALPEIVESTFVVEVSYAEDDGTQLIDDTQFIESIEPLEADSSLAFDARDVENPLASSAMPTIKLDLFEAPAEMKTPTIGLALSGRQKGAKRALLAAYGGTNQTESAVDLALSWLKRQQRGDGTWRLDGPYSDGAPDTENEVAATAMAMLAFQGAGNTHQSGDHQAIVKKGMEALLRMQDRDGSFFATRRLPSSHQLYSQAQATIVICELYGMTQDESLREPAQRALDYAGSIQADDGRGGGGWRYQPGDQVDLSVTGWFVIAIKSGEMGRLSVPSPVKDKIRRFLDNVTAMPTEFEQFTEGSRYLYRIGEKEQRLSMTAEALLCRQYLGWTQEDPRLMAGVDFINENPIDWQHPHIYYWYYATQVMHHMGGDAWDKWNEEMRTSVPDAQIRSGRERGSWSPARDKFAYTGGRLFMTCMCTYMLEVYYRHMPIYQH